MFAAHHQLKNFMVIVDQNGFQAMGKTSEVLALYSLARKFEAFGFEVIPVDGHDQQALDQTISALSSSDNLAPKAVIARTIKGKGVAFMENNNRWHYTRLTSETFAQALACLYLESAK